MRSFVLPAFHGGIDQEAQERFLVGRSLFDGTEPDDRGLELLVRPADHFLSLGFREIVHAGEPMLKEGR